MRVLGSGYKGLGVYAGWSVLEREEGRRERAVLSLCFSKLRHGAPSLTKKGISRSTPPSALFLLCFLFPKHAERRKDQTIRGQGTILNARQAKVEHFFRERERKRKEEEEFFLCEEKKSTSKKTKTKTMTSSPSPSFDEQWDVEITLDWLQSLVGGSGRGRRREEDEEEKQQTKEGDEGAAPPATAVKQKSSHRNRIRRVVLQFPDALLPVALAVQACLSAGSIARGLELEVRFCAEERKTRAETLRRRHRKNKTSRHNSTPPPTLSLYRFQKFYVLADSTFNPAAVDELACVRGGGDAVVHYGRAEAPSL